MGDGGINLRGHMFALSSEVGVGNVGNIDVLQK